MFKIIPEPVSGIKGFARRITTDILVASALIKELGEHVQSEEGDFYWHGRIEYNNGEFSHPFTLVTQENGSADVYIEMKDTSAFSVLKKYAETLVVNEPILVIPKMR